MKKQFTFSLVAMLLLTFSFTQLTVKAQPQVEKCPQIKSFPIESKAQFDLQFEYPVGVGGGEAGIETDGNYIFTTRWNGNEFYKYSLDGTYIGSFTCGTATNIRDLAYDGTYFYGAAASPTVYQLDLNAQNVISTFTAPTDCRAIAYDEDDDTFYSNNWGSNIVKFNKAGYNLGDFPIGAIGNNYYGFAYQSDTYVPGEGPFLWGYAQVGATLNELVQISLPDGIETGVYFDVASALSDTVTSSAGGLYISDEFVSGFWTIGGLIQNEWLWGLELGAAAPPPVNDLAVISIVNPSSGVDLSSTEVVTLNIINMGSNSQSNFNVSYSINGSTPVIETVSATINSFETYSYSFTTTADLSIYGIYSFEACTILSNDENTYNDCNIKDVENSEFTYCTTSYLNQIDDWISNVTFITIDNASGAETNGYADYTAISTFVEQSSNYDISVDVFVNGDWVQNTWVWIDWNQDLDFTDPGEAYDLGETPGTQGTFTLTANISVPPNATIGSTRMRVAELYEIDPEPCTQSTYGEAEDYSIEVSESSLLSPINLIGDINNNNVTLNWSPPPTITVDPQWIQWDNGTNTGNGIGLSQGGIFYVASHWNPSDLDAYDGMSVTQMSFFPNEDTSASFVLKIWTGANASVEVMSQDVTSYIIDDFNIVNLVNPITIDATMEYWFGYEVIQESIGTSPAGHDDGPAVQELGDMISLDGSSWSSMSAEYGLDYNWNIAIYVDNLKNATPLKPITKSILPVSDGIFVDSEEAGAINFFNPGSAKKLTGYNIYRNGVIIATTTDTTYADKNLDSGTFEYFITAIYNEDESGASNTVSVEIKDVYHFNMRLFLEGPFLSNQMIQFLNFQGYIPLEQPYSTEPWNYWGNESVAAIPNADVVDWVLVELRKTTGDISTAIADSTIDMEAAFLLKDGSIVGLDGAGPLKLIVSSSPGDLYAVVWHRNHLGLISNYPLTKTAGVYDYDFTTAANQAYGGQYVMKEQYSGIWCALSGDGLNDTKINNEDKNEVWVQEFDSLGYFDGDFNMDGQVNNSDKEFYWKPNSGKVGMVPGGPRINWGFTCGDALVDSRDGQSYNTVQIFDQCWMAENLNIGTQISTSINQSNNNTLEKYCTGDCSVYGGLYIWEEMMQYVQFEGAKGICPSGWHIPSISEYLTLIDTLGGYDTAGGKLKESGASHWLSPNTGATNESGFTALPGGAIYNNSIYFTSELGYFWTSSDSYGLGGDHIAHYCELRYFDSKAITDYSSLSTSYGYSVRCIKDE